MQKVQKYSYFFVFLFLNLCTKGQISMSYTGIVLDDETKNTLEEVICEALDKDRRIISYSITDEKGTFSLKNNENVQFLVFKLLGYKTIEIPAKEINTPDQVEINLEKESFTLPEIKITVPPIQKKNDTITYQVNSFKGQEDRYIGDVLKKLPGIKVNDDGSITYQGEAINKFYIEGRDLLGGQYNLATENLAVDAVSQIEVLENNQHIKALKGIEFSEKAAINLKLKKGYIVKPFGEAALGAGGTPTLYDGRLFITQLGSKVQTLGNFKINNRGRAILGEIEDKLDVNNLFSYEPLPENMIILPSPQNIPLSLDRYLFNKTYLGSLHHLIVCSPNTEIRLNFSYGSDRTRQNFLSQQNYATGGNTLQINERTGLTHKIDNYRLAFIIEHNSLNKYLKNELRSYGKREKALSAIHSKNRQLSTSNKNTPFYIQNNLQGLLKYDGDKTIDFHSFFRYSDNTEFLKTGLQDTNENRLEETFTGKYIISKNRIGTSFNLWRHRLDIGWKIDYKQRRLDNELFQNGVAFPSPEELKMRELENKTELFQTGISPHYQIKSGTRFVLTFDLPFTYSQYRVKNVSQPSFSDRKWLFMPAVKVNYLINHRWETSGRLGYEDRYADDKSLLNTSYFSNYRMIYLAAGKLNSSKNFNLSASIRYKDIIRLLFFNAQILYRISRFDYMPRSYNTSEWSYYTTENKSNTGSQFIATAQLSKTILPLQLTLTLSPSYTRFESEFIQQDLRISNTSHATILALKAEVKALKKASFIYHIDGHATWNDNSLTNRVILKNLMQKLFLYYFPRKNIDLSIAFDYTLLEKEKDSYSSYYFLDLVAKYKLKKMEFGFTASNLFNKKSYSLTSLSTVNTFYQNIPLRGREFLFTVKMNF